jgi:hypothetical protein
MTPWPKPNSRSLNFRSWRRCGPAELLPFARFRKLFPNETGQLTTVQTAEFKNGCGKFFAQDVFNGKRIFNRFVWTDMTTNSPQFEQSFSDDGGKTWEVNWITDPTRISDESDKAHRSEPHPRGPS